MIDNPNNKYTTQIITKQVNIIPDAFGPGIDYVNFPQTINMRIFPKKDQVVLAGNFEILVPGPDVYGNPCGTGPFPCGVTHRVNNGPIAPHGGITYLEEQARTKYVFYGYFSFLNPGTLSSINRYVQYIYLEEVYSPNDLYPVYIDVKVNLMGLGLQDIYDPNNPNFTLGIDFDLKQ